MKKNISRLIICTMLAVFILMGVNKQEKIYAATTIEVNIDSGSSFADSVNKALREARDNATDSNRYIIKIPKGSYTLTDNLCVYSNTTIDLTDVTLHREGSSGNFILTGKTEVNETEQVAGYSGYRNITIKGGTFMGNSQNSSVILRFQHGKNITMDGCTLVGGGGGHQMEAAAVDGLTIKNCTFKDFDPKRVSGSSYEALQIDIPCNSNVFDYSYLDGTPCKNISITDNTFENLPRAVGSHTHLQYVYVENVDISNNTFTNMEEMAITCVDYYNCTIKNNVMKDCGQGIVFSYGRNTAHSMYTTIFNGDDKTSGTTRHDAKTVISDNEISIKYNSANAETAGIRIQGYNWKESKKGGDGKVFGPEDYYVSGVAIRDNKITTAGYGVHFYDARKCVIANNTIIGKDFANGDSNKDKYVGIRVSDESQDIDILSKNTISGMPLHGIYVMTQSSASDIKNQSISDCKGSGIQFNNSSVCKGVVGFNTISSCGDGGIYVNGGSKVARIEGNTINAVYGKAGISVYTANIGTITKNIIKDCCKDASGVLVSGIKIGTDSACDVISENSIISSDSSKKSCRRGIEVYKNSVVNQSIAKNIIENCDDKGIIVSEQSTVKKSITGNNINATGGSGISIESIKNDLKINGNTISASGTHCIMLKSGNSAYSFKLYSNSITGTGKKNNGMHLMSGKIEIGNNTFEATNRAIFLDKSMSGNVWSNSYKNCKTKVYIGKNVDVLKASAIKSAKGKRKAIEVNLKKKVAKASGYAICYSTDKKFGKYDYITIKANKKKATIKGLASKKTYYVKMATYVAKGKINVYGDFGPVKSVKTK